MEYVFTPWKNRLLEDLQTAREEVVLISPFIKTSVAREIYQILANKGVHVRTVSRFSKSEFLSGASDIDAHFMLADGSERSKAKYELRSLSNVHAKIFVIDWRIAYVGSSNLTFSGLLRNYEGTVRLTGEQEIAPLKRRFCELWNGLRPVTTQDFTRMLHVLSTTKVQRRGDESEHLYDVNNPIDSGREDVAESTILNVITEDAFWLPAADVRPPTVGDLITEEFVTDEAGKARANDTAAPAQEETKTDTDAASAATDVRQPGGVTEADAVSTATRKARLEHHVYIIWRFLEVLSNRFSLRTNDPASRYALAIKTPSINGMWSEDLMPQEQFAPTDPLILYGKQKDELDVLGGAIYEACTAHIAVKLGIVERFGYTFANAFMAKARELPVITALWHQNLLGPLLTGLSVGTSADRKHLERATATALKRLLAAVYLEEGLPRVLELVEEFMNPADMLGTDIVSLADFEDEKTTLQNVAQMVTGWAPKYTEPTSTGLAHNAVWKCSVKVGKTISAQGEGGSVREASMAAARAALDIIAIHPTWSRKLIEYKNNLYRKAAKLHHPLFPNVSLDAGARERVREVFARRYNISIQPSLGYVACIDQETRKMMGLSYSNSTMAWYGSYLIQIFLATITAGKGVVLTGEFWKQMPLDLDVENLRKEMGISHAFSDLRGQGSQIVQALATAAYFSNPFPVVADMFMRYIDKIIDATCGANHDQKSRESIRRLVEQYDGAKPYTTVLQELIQSKTTLLPSYTVTKIDQSGGPGAEDAVEMTANWSDLTVRSRARNKVMAKNKCAFELLRKLLGKTEFWQTTENDLPD